MIAHIATDSRANLVGSLWMVTAMAVFAVEDAFIKAAAATLPAGQVLILFGLGGALAFAGLACANRERLFTRDAVSPTMRIRAVFETTGRLFFVLALALTPLSSATMILQATPLVVVAGAALVFGETVGWRRWTAILIGLAGVVVIVQPWTDGFTPLSVLAIIGMLGFACRDLASRAAPASLSASVLGFYGFLAVLAAGVLVSVWQAVPFVVPSIAVCLVVLGAVGCGVFAYSCLMKAMRTGEVSAVTPFRYTRLLFGIALGVVLFGERLSPAMLVGSGLIVLSGLFILWRGQRAKVEPPAAGR